MKSLKSILSGILILFPFIFFFNYSNTYTQSLDDLMLSTYWDFYSTNYLSTQASGRGYTGIAGKNDLSGALLNPASLELNSKYTVITGYIFKSTSQYLPKSFNDMFLEQYHPTGIGGVGIKLNKFLQMGVLVHVDNSYIFSLKNVIITNEFGQTIDSGDVDQKLSASTLSLPVSVNYKEKFKAGINLNYSFYSNYLSNYRPVSSEQGYEATARFQVFYPTLGLIYSPTKYFSIGAVFTPEIRARAKSKTGSTETEYRDENIIPMKISAGLDYNFNAIPLKVLIDYNYSKSSADERMRDRHDLNIGFEYKPNEVLILRTGFFTVRDMRKTDNFGIYPYGSYSQYFITAGASYQLKHFMFNLALMDSHVLSSGEFKRTMINGSVSWEYGK